MSSESEREALLRDLYALRGWTGGDVLRRIEIIDRAMAALSRSEVPEPSADQDAEYDARLGDGDRDDPEPQDEPSDAEVDAAADAIRWASERGGWVDMARAALRAAGGAR